MRVRLSGRLWLWASGVCSGLAFASLVVSPGWPTLALVCSAACLMVNIDDA